MWLVLLALLAGAAWYAAASLRSAMRAAERKLEADRIAREREVAVRDEATQYQSLAVTEIDLSGPRTEDRARVNRWTVDFRSMRGAWEDVFADDRGMHENSYTEHWLRTQPDGSWQRKETDESHRAFVDRERRDFERRQQEGYAGAETWEEYAEGWGWSREPEWVPVEDELATVLSARYDVYVRNWKGDIPPG